MLSVGEVLALGRTLTPLDRGYWLRPCPFCEQVLEPYQDEDGYWIPGLARPKGDALRHSCEGLEAERVLQAERRAKQEEEKDEARWEAICKRANMTERRLELTFDSFEKERQPEAYDEADHFFIEPISLLLCGPVGVGKTHLASAMMNRWIRTGFEKHIHKPMYSYVGGRGYFATLPRLLTRIRGSYNRDKSIETEEQILEYMTEVPLLVLDDLGKETDSDFSRRALFNIMDGRYVKNRPIIITSNETGDKLIKQMGQASYSRMLEMGKVIQMRRSGDYRLRANERKETELPW